MVPPVESKELALLMWMLQQGTGLTILKNFGIDVPEKFAVTEHNGQPDEPPDLTAFDYGFECTEFPPNLTTISKIHLQKGTAIIVPPFQRTGKGYGAIRREIDASVSKSSITGGHYELGKEQKSLADEFRNVISGPKSKDIPGNDILLLDQRNEVFGDITVEPAIRSVLANWKLKHIRLIIMVRAKESLQVFP